MSKTRYDSVSSVPAIVDDIRATQHKHDVHYEPQPPEPAIATVEILAHLIVGIIVGWGMWLSRSDVALAMLTGVGYFAAMTTLRILAKTDTLKAWLNYWLDYRLEKHRINTLADLADRHFDLLEMQERHKTPLPAPETPHVPPAENYVPPHQPEAIAEAVAWAETLFGSDGYLDPRKVYANGKVKGAVVGSRRGGGSVEAKQYLIARGFLAAHAGGYWVNVKKFPTRVELARLRR